MIASRDKTLDILSIDADDNMGFDNLDFAKIDEDRIVDYTNFVEATGLLDFCKESQSFFSGLRLWSRGGT